MSQSWVADRYHVYLWILDIVIFRPDKFCSQAVVRGNVSGHRWSTYLLKQSMIESGYIYIYSWWCIIRAIQIILSRQTDCNLVGPERSAAPFEPRSAAGSANILSSAGWSSRAWSPSSEVLAAPPRRCRAPPSAEGLPAGKGQAWFCAGRRRRETALFVLFAAAVPHLGCDGIAEVMEFRPELQNDNQST